MTSDHATRHIESSIWMHTLTLLRRLKVGLRSFCYPQRVILPVPLKILTLGVIAGGGILRELVSDWTLNGEKDPVEYRESLRWFVGYIWFLPGLTIRGVPPLPLLNERSRGVWGASRKQEISVIWQTTLSWGNEIELNGVLMMLSSEFDNNLHIMLISIANIIININIINPKMFYCLLK